MYRQNNVLLIVGLLVTILSNYSTLICSESEGKDTEPSGFQEYFYTGRSVSVTFSTDKIEICDEDSLVISLSIQNYSQNSIFVFQGFDLIDYLSPMVDEVSDIVIRFGGQFESHFDHQIILKEISPKSSYEIKHILSNVELRKKRLKKIFHVFLSFGYIESIKKVEEFQKSSTIPILSQLDQGSLKISSNVVDLALTRLELGDLRLKKCNK